MCVLRQTEPYDSECWCEGSELGDLGIKGLVLVSVVWF